jgi:hypothetical protein
MRTRKIRLAKDKINVVMLSLKRESSDAARLANQAGVNLEKALISMLFQETTQLPILLFPSADHGIPFTRSLSASTRSHTRKSHNGRD